MDDDRRPPKFCEDGPSHALNGAAAATTSSHALRSLMLQARGRHRTAAPMIMDTLHAAIIEGVISGGTALRQDELAATLSVSRMPIREALRQLEVEGLVEFTPHKGAVVASLDPEDIEEIVELRVALEGLALTLSLPRLDRATLEAAETLVERIDAEESLSVRNALNREFHTTLYSGVRRPRLLRQIRGLYDAFDRYLRVEHSLLDRRTESQKEHRRILDACRRGNLAVAVGELAGHIAGAGVSLAALLRAGHVGEHECGIGSNRPVINAEADDTNLPTEDV